MAKVKQIGIRLDAETLEKLTTLTQGGKLSQAQVITEAIEILSSNNPPTDDLLKRLDALAENDAALKAGVDELRTLITQVLKNQQKGE
jgi:predicted DNA-binding protein